MPYGKLGKYTYDLIYPNINEPLANLIGFSPVCLGHRHSHGSVSPVLEAGVGLAQAPGGPSHIFPLFRQFNNERTGSTQIGHCHFSLLASRAQKNVIRCVVIKN
jgi:hypothetical protein